MSQPSERVGMDRRQRLSRLVPVLIRFAINSLVVLAFKLGAMFILGQYLHASLAYAVVHVFVLFLSYELHARISFRAKRSWRSFFAFTKAVLGIKLVDYLVFNVAFSYFNVQALWSVVAATMAIFVIRFGTMRKALTHRPPGDSIPNDGHR